MNISIQDIEDRIIGHLLCDGKKATLEACSLIDETDFSDPACSILFGVCVALVSQHKSVDVLSVHQFLQNNVEKLGTHFQKLSSFTDAKTAINNLILRATDLATMYATRGYSNDLLTNCKYLRQETERKKAQEIILSAGTKLNDGIEVETVIEEAARELITLSAKSQNIKSYTHLEDAFDEAIKETEDEIAGKVVRLSTGFHDLDRIIYGLEKGRLYCIAAEEKIGKSLLSYQIGLNSASKGNPSAIISMEMKASEIAKRFAGVNSGQEALHRLNALKKLKAEIGKYPLFIRDGSANQGKVFITIHKLYAEKQVELLIVDYLQLIELQGKDRVNEVNDFVGKLKGLAMDLNIPIVLISAVLNKQLSHRNDRKPTPADLRDTGRLANDADCLMFLWKPDEQDENYLELFVARSRYSKLGRIGLFLDPETLKLSQTELRDLGSSSYQSTEFKRF
ncbi:MAG: DnaB-like helicase C-terminal domain-containing protein [Bacteroidota bacterium]|nr:DnaB-like helicase C-terminal domain-containing protein [Bacteroidota bacterium]